MARIKKRLNICYNSAIHEEFEIELGDYQSIEEFK
jgi:hypothetical protein